MRLPGIKTLFQKLGKVIKNHPVEAFFLLATGICYLTLFPAIYVVPHDAGLFGILGFYLGKIGVYSPVIAGIAITRITNPGPPKVNFTRRLKISLPVWIIAIIVNIAGLKLTAPAGVSMTGLILLSIPVALLPAWVISSAFSGSESIRDMLSTLIRPKGKFVYYLIALMTFPIVMVTGAVITNIISGEAWFTVIPRPGSLLVKVLINFFVVIFYAGGINEESGWRGFGQKRLQSVYSPFVSAILLWVFMVIWHIPNDCIQYQNGGYIMIRIVLYFFITILFTWVYNRTNGSILPVIIFHASMNSMNPLMGVFPITTASNVLLIGFAVFVLITDHMWRKLPVDHPAVFPETDQDKSQDPGILT